MQIKLNEVQQRLSEIDATKFHKMVDTYLNQKYNYSIHSTGTKTGEDKPRKGTPDTLITLENGEYIFVEYTTQKTKVKDKFLDDIEKCLDSKKTGISIQKIAKIIIACNSSLQANDIEALRLSCGDIECEVLTNSTLSYDFVNHFPSIAKEFLGIDIGNILTPNVLKKEYNDFKNSYDKLNVENLLLEKRIKIPSEILNEKSKEIHFNKFVDISKKSLIIAKSTYIKNNFHKSIAYLWSQGEIYQEFKYLIYISLKRGRTIGLKSLIRDNYYALDDKLITLDLKENNQDILFLFDGLDGLNWEKREELIKEINTYNIKYYVFITSKERGVHVHKEFEFDESFSLSSLPLKNVIKEKKHFPFKVKIFNYLKNYFEAYNSEYSIIMNKKLYSNDIEENLIFDIIIEFYLPLKFLIIVKCFDHSKHLSLQNIQNFYNKKKEVNAQKIIIVSSEPFESNIIHYAEKRNKDIGLLYYEDTDNYEWLLRRSPSAIRYENNKKLNETNTYSALSNGEYTNSISIFMINLLSTNSQKDIFNSALTINNRFKNNYRKVQFLNDKMINQFVNKLLSKISYEDGIVDFDKIGSILKKEHNLTIQYNQVLESNVLGEINFETALISIDNHQCETLARMRFTIAHEIGHYLLGHGYYMYGEKYTNMHDTLNNQLPDNIIKMEWQANQFASFLLLPINNFLKDVNLLFKEFNIKGKLYVDNQKCNIDTFMQITNRLMHKYKVSRSVVEIRLKKLELLQKVDTYEFVKNVHQGITNKKINWDHHD